MYPTTQLRTLNYDETMKILLKAGFSTILLIAVAFTQISVAQSRAEAITAFNAALEVAKGSDIPAAIASFQKAADIATKAGDSKDIKEKAEKQIPNLQFSLAANLYRAGKVAESIDAFKKAAEFGTRYGDADTKRKSENNLPTLYYTLGTNHLKASRYAEANSAYDEALKLNANFSNAYYGKFLVLKAQDNWTAALEMAEKTIQVATTAKDTKVVTATQENVRKELTYRAVKRAEAKSYSEAITMLNDAVKYGEDADIYYRLAETYNKMGQSDNAISNANKALELEKGGRPDKAKIYFELGMAQMSKGNFPAACSAFGEAAVGNFKTAADHHMQHDLKCGGAAPGN